MNNLITSNTITMSSIDFWMDIISPARTEAGEPKSTYQNFLNKVVDELDLTDGDVMKHISEKINNLGFSVSYETPMVNLDFDQMMLVGMRESKAVRRSVLGKLKAMNATQIPQTLPEALRLAADLAEQKQQLENQLAIAAPKVEFADRVGESEGVLIGNYAKVVKLGQNKLFAWLRDNGILIASGSRRNVPKQEYMDRGYFTVKETAVNTNHGIHISFTTKLTGKGQQWLTRKLVDNGLLKALGDAA
ncbi:Phage antirepressor protein KilAC domain protein [Citrobacter koseri]|uniref:Phage antirepressor protein KilAC domain protein n=1 Tax=Citrobacter koseri TaxID=545 RepID=A0A078L897_CITKO|nr:Phage antirepressor protein KilAC domain protein [Citrobacter koseri]